MIHTPLYVKMVHGLHCKLQPTSYLPVIVDKQPPEERQGPVGECAYQQKNRRQRGISKNEPLLPLTGKRCQSMNAGENYKPSLKF